MIIIMAGALEVYRYVWLRRLGLIVLAVLINACEPYVPDLYGGVTGIVASAQTGEPVPGCEVVLVDTGTSELTDSDGMYEFDGLKEGFYTILVQKAGYYEDRKNVKVASGEFAQLSFILKPIYK